jgi:hypothetical protein
VAALTLEIRVGEREAIELLEVACPQRREPSEDVGDRPTGVALEPGLAVDRSERLVRPVVDDRPDAAEPVVLLDVREVRERLPRRPRPLALVRGQPPLRQPGELRLERARRCNEDLAGLDEIEGRHACWLPAAGR